MRLRVLAGGLAARTRAGHQPFSAVNGILEREGHSAHSLQCERSWQIRAENPLRSALRALSRAAAVAGLVSSSTTCSRAAVPYG